MYLVISRVQWAQKGLQTSEKHTSDVPLSALRVSADLGFGSWRAQAWENPGLATGQNLQERDW